MLVITRGYISRKSPFWWVVSHKPSIPTWQLFSWQPGFPNSSILHPLPRRNTKHVRRVSNSQQAVRRVNAGRSAFFSVFEWLDTTSLSQNRLKKRCFCWGNHRKTPWLIFGMDRWSKHRSVYGKSSVINFPVVFCERWPSEVWILLRGDLSMSEITDVVFSTKGHSHTVMEEENLCFLKPLLNIQPRKTAEWHGSHFEVHFVWQVGDGFGG